MTIFRDIRLSFFLASRVLSRSSRLTTVLILFIMTLTFVSLVAVSGILVGLIDGGNNANRQQYTSDIIITRKAGEAVIADTPRIVSYLQQNPYVNHFSVREGVGVTIEADVAQRSDFQKKGDTVGTQLVGIDVIDENLLTGLSRYVKEGDFLKPTESGYIVLGADLIRRYNAGFGDGFDSLDEVYPGEIVRITSGDRAFNFIVKGIVDTKVGEVSLRAFVNKSDLNLLRESGSQNANEIAIQVTDPQYAPIVQKSLYDQGFGKTAKVQLASEAIPDFLNQIRIAFGLLGNMIGFIGLIVAATTIFIIVFMNAVTRQKYIGILKGIGITPRVIVIAYIIQALFYALVGSLIACGIIYGLLVPLFLAHPLDFPFSDGILSAPIGGTISRFVILLVISFFAGMIPAWRIVRRNTLNSILGR